MASCGQVDDGTTVATGVLHHAHRAVDPPSCRNQPCGVVVLGEYGEASDRGIRVQLNNPAVVVERRKQQLLGLHRWPVFYGVQRTKDRLESIEDLMRQRANPPERMARRDPLDDRDARNQEIVERALTLNRSWTIGPGWR